MQSIILIILVGLAGGVAVGLQGPMASLMTQRIGVFESIFIVHLGGALLALLPLLVLGGGHLGEWRSVPWYALCAGFFGLVVLSAISYIIPRVGVATSIITVVAGQLAVGTVLDQYGLLGGSGRPLDATRLLGLICVMAGVWLTVK
jgi:bacterial/archaeal transporter family-2 protein